MRNLLIFLLALLGIWWVRRALGKARDAHGSGKADGAASRKRFEHIVECAHCGVHVPETDGVRDGRHFFCCEAHRLAGPRKRD